MTAGDIIAYGASHSRRLFAGNF